MYDENTNEWRDDIMMIEDRFFDQSWVQELNNEDFRMLMYLFHFASKKTGIVELNMRMLNFAANTGCVFTKAELLKRFSNMICLVPGKDNTAIFPDWIATNWAKNGKPIDVVRNPLFKSVVQELASFGLTIKDVNKLSKKQVVVKGCEDECADVSASVVSDAGDEGRKLNKPSVSQADLDVMFDGFWKAYPSSCPRKVDKKKCRDKFERILKAADDAVGKFNGIMAGLETWKKSEMWNSNGGAYIRMPLVWLNNESWNDKPSEGGRYGNQGCGKANANANYKSSEADGLF